ncbi:MAG: NusG domain II-containing protein [Ruminococcaceae bacterium]|nr:NusG domain II-containing protein [Oscillospiraceae bacterium]
MKKSRRQFFSMFDIVIILVAIVASVIALVSQLNSNSSNLSCVVRVEGEVVRTVELNPFDDELTLYEVKGEFPVTIVIESDSVYVKSASCPDKLCEHTGEITRAGQSIVCLPAKVSVTLEGKSKNDLDAVVG